VRDDKGEVEATAAIASGSALGFRTLALVGPTVRSGFQAVRDAANENEVVALVPIGSPSKMANGDWTFTLLASAYKNGVVMGRLLQKIIKSPSVVQYSHDVLETTGFWGGILEAFMGSGVEQINQVDWPKNATPAQIAEQMALNNWHDVSIISLPMDEAEVVLRALREYGYIGTVVVEGEASLEQFAQRFKSDRNELLKIGQMTNNVLSVVPFTSTIASEKSQSLISDYRIQTGNEPSWAYAYGYDAGLLISNFVRDSKAKGLFNLSNPDLMRAELKKNLTQLRANENATVGFTGPIDFKENNTRELSPRLVMYRERKQTPYFIQVSDTPSLPSDQAELSDYIVLDQLSYRVVPVVHVGINPRSFSAINLDAGTFETTFDMWFKSKDLIDIADIQFLNAVGDLKSVILKEEKQQASENYRRYLVNGVFRFDPTPSDLVLDKIHLQMLWRHRKLDLTQLKFVADPEVFYVSGTNPKTAAQGYDGLAVAGYGPQSSFLAIDNKQIKALGDNRGLRGFVDYSVGSFQIELQRNISTLTSHIVRLFSTKVLQDIFGVAVLILIAASLFWLVKPRAYFEALFCLWLIFTSTLSETILFTLPLTAKVDVETLALIRTSYNFLFIFLAVRLGDMALLALMWRKGKKVKTVQPVILFFSRVGLYFGGVAVFYMGVLGKDLLPILATASVLLTVIGLALRELIFDSVAGIALAADQNVAVGQWINFKTKDRNLSGVVEMLGWRFVTLRSRDQQAHYIPNSIFATQILSNLSNDQGYIRIEIPFLMAVQVEADRLFRVLIDELKEPLEQVPHVDRSRPVRVQLDGLQEQSVRCVVQIFYSPEVSTDQLKTTVLEVVRRVLVKEDALPNLWPSFRPDLHAV
jgi:small-conductance mechanosensitive channel/ABC-type branched-subunit amino acid transport system substrate-binding protein